MDPSSLHGPVPPGSVLLAVEEPIETAHGMANVVIKKTASRSNARAVEELTVERNALMTMGKHPFILELCGSYNDPQGNEVMLTEYVNGSTLWRLMQLRPHVPEAWVRFYATELVLALEHVHASCLIHRDVAPQSVIVATSGHVRLTSFGSASLVPYVEPGGELRIGMSSGVAPEMLLNGGYGASVDWWGLGCIMHQMFVGRPAEDDSTADGSAAGPMATEPAGLTTLATVATAAERAATDSSTPAHSEGSEVWTRYSSANPVSAEAAALVEQLLIRHERLGVGSNVLTARPHLSRLRFINAQRSSSSHRRNPERRIGTHGVIEIKMHAWFSDVDWDAALSRRGASPPWCPNPPDVDVESFAKEKMTHSTGSNVQQGVLPFQYPPVNL